MKVCTIDGCENKSHSHGMCRTHKGRLDRNGDPLLVKRREKGSGSIKDGYVLKGSNGKRIREHVLIAESALGKPLPKGAVVHHANENRSDNRNINLVICPSRAYHNLIHARMDAMLASGDPSKRKCRCCNRYDSIENMSSCDSGTTMVYWHKQCEAIRSHERRSHAFVR